MFLSVQTARSLRSHSVYAARLYSARRPLSIKAESPGCPLVGVQSLQRIDEDAGDVPAVAQHAQRRVIHILQRVGFMRGLRIAHSRLHITPTSHDRHRRSARGFCAACDSARGGPPA